MKALIVYYSLKGNTKKIAEAIYDAMLQEREIGDGSQDFSLYQVQFLMNRPQKTIFNLKDSRTVPSLKK